MAEIITQIPGFEIGAVEHIRTTNEVQALFLAAQEISELLNQWNTNVGFFSLSSRTDGLKALVDNKSSVARLYTVNQKNHDLNVILRKARGWSTVSLSEQSSSRACLAKWMPWCSAA